MICPFFASYNVGRNTDERFWRVCSRHLGSGVAWVLQGTGVEHVTVIPEYVRHPCDVPVIIPVVA